VLRLFPTKYFPIHHFSLRILSSTLLVYIV
jgi:hypothetical protein